MKILFPFIVSIILLLGCREDIFTSPEEGPGSFTVSSSPQGAEIFVNNKITNSITPKDFDNVSPGNYSITLIREGFTDTTFIIKVESGKRKIINVSLEFEN